MLVRVLAGPLEGKTVEMGTRQAAAAVANGWAVPADVAEASKRNASPRGARVAPEAEKES
jgi:hypothetical protein